MALKYKYKPRDPDAWEKRANQQGGDFIGIFKSEYKTFQTTKGDNFIRLLPPTWEDAEHYGLDIYVHYGIGPDRATVLCLNKMKGKHCPICEAAAKALKAGDEELAKELRINKRVLVWLIDRKDASKGPMLWAMPWTVDRDIVKSSRDRVSGEIYALDDPDEGYDISFERTGEQTLTKYLALQPARRPTSIDDATLEYAVNNPLTEVLLYRSYDEIKKIYEGGEPDDKEKEDEERPAPKRARRDEPDEEEPEARGRRAHREEAEEHRARDRRKEPEPEEEEEKPRRRTARAEEPEEEPEDKPKFQPRGRRAREEPEEEEEAPPPKRRAAREEPEEDAEEEAPPPRRKAPPKEEPEDEPEERPRRRQAAPEPEEEERPRRRAAREEPEEEEAPPRRARREEPEEAPAKSRADILREKMAARKG